MNPGRFGHIWHTITTEWTVEFAYCVSGNQFNVSKYWVTIITLTLCIFIAHQILTVSVFFYPYIIYPSLRITAKEGLKKYIKKDTQLKCSKTISLRFCLADFTWRLLWRSFNCLRWQRLSDENYHSNEINTSLPPKLKSADNVHDR